MGRYDIALGEVPGEIVGINQVGVSVGLIDKHTEPGYMLADGAVLLENEKDEAGFYVGGAGMDGMFLRTAERYEPIRDDDGTIYAFRRMSAYLSRFTAEEQVLIFQYGMNTRDNLVEDLTAALPQLKKAPRSMICSTARRKSCARCRTATAPA